VLVVVSDTSPLRYLTLIGESDLIRLLYKTVVVPPSVIAELSHPMAPARVREFVETSPRFLEMFDSEIRPDATLAHLDIGERDAILVAEQLRADLLLMDDRDGVVEARSRGLAVTGTLGVLVAAAERNKIDLPTAFELLKEPNFRASPGLLESILKRTQRL